MEQGFCLFVELFPSTGVLWVIGVRLHISILYDYHPLLIKIVFYNAITNTHTQVISIITAKLMHPDSKATADLMYIMFNGAHRGWRVDLCVKWLTSSEKRLLVCKLCKGILRDAETMDTERRELRCYLCMPVHLRSYQPIPQDIREAVNYLQVRCQVYSCNWKGKLMNLEQHVIKCPLMIVPCPNYCVDDETGAVTEMERKLVKKHLKDTCIMRKVPCHYCSFLIRPCDRQFHNTNECDGVLELCSVQPIHCVNGCGMMFQVKEMMEQHSKDECKYRSVLNQQNIDKMKIVLDEQTEKISRLELENYRLKQELTKIHPPLKTPSHGNYEWTLCRVSEKIASRKRCYSEPFNVGLYTFQTFVNWCTQDANQCIGVYIQIMQGESDGSLDWPLMYTATVSLKNYLAKGDNHVKRFDVDKRCVKDNRGDKYRGYGIPNFITVAEMLSAKFCKLGTTKIEVSISTMV